MTQDNLATCDDRVDVVTIPRSEFERMIKEKNRRFKGGVLIGSKFLDELLHLTTPKQINTCQLILGCYPDETTLVHCSSLGWIEAANIGGEWIRIDGESLSETPTHWLPLPSFKGVNL